MPRLPPFTLSPAAVRKLAVDLAEAADEGWGLRVTVYYVGEASSRQYHLEPVEHGAAGDIRLDFPDGPVTVWVEPESFMRLWGYVLDVGPVVNGRPGELGLRFLDPG